MTSNKLNKLNDKYFENKIHEIKLKEILQLRDEENYLNEICTLFPPITIGSVTLVDQIVLLCLDELIQPKNILEIGTFQGFTTRLFIKNSKASKIYSIDLPSTDNLIIKEPNTERVFTDGNYNDNFLRDVQNETGEIYLKDLSAEDTLRLQLIKHDSTTFNYTENFESIQLAFIDGGHHFDIVKKDTENVLRTMKHGVIVWHDYASGIHSDVTRYLDERSNTNNIFHVTGSLCAFQII